MRRFLICGITAGSVMAALTVAAPHMIAQSTTRVSASTLHELTSMDALRETFTADQGKVRILLLLSPT